jgi:hypothetical protein
MAALRFAENYYSFRATEQVFQSSLVAQSPNQAALAAIEAKLVEANNNFLGRRYQEAISAYNQAAALIYAQIRPPFPSSVYVDYSALPRDPGLFDVILSASLEWMNLMPINDPGLGVRPRVPVNPGLIGDAAKFERVGIVSTKLSDERAMNATADFQLSQTYTELGNTKAAEFFSKRASDSDVNTVKILKETSANKASTVSEPPPPGIIERFLRATGIIRATPAPVVVADTRPPATIIVAAPMARGGGSGASSTAVILGSPPASLPAAMTAARSFGTLIDGKVLAFTWTAGDGPPLAQIRKDYYEARVSATSLTALSQNSRMRSDVALDLPHAYYYVVPLGLAECYHALGDFAQAETKYFAAASYQYLNALIEAPYLWQRIATLYLDWGNSLFRNDQAPDALPIYLRVVGLNSTVPTSALFTTASLRPGADVARTVIANLDNVLTLTVNPLIAAVIVDVHQQLLKVQGGLDFWGFWAPTVPIWTFEYLQNATINFTQLAINAERDVVNFWDRADQATLTRQQIAQGASQAAAEVQAAQLQANAASAEAAAYTAALDLAQQRAADATANANEYASNSALSIQLQAASSQVSGGADGNYDEINGYADRILAGQGLQDIQTGTLSASLQLAGSRLNRQYEVDSLRRQATEMTLARNQAQAERTAANARVAAANAGVNVARLRAQGAQQLLDTFDDQFFTPDVWYRMGQTMWRLYRRYLDMALRTAKLMQAAYNFETDQSLRLIKTDYSTDEVKGFLGAESLLADVQTFTYDLITSQLSKPQPVRQTISLAERYGFAFENQLRKTGAMNFETRIDDFDSYYPGTYSGRIERVEVEVDGIVPVRGISGTLTNSGISAYRTPASLWLDPATSGLKYRVQSREALVISDYAERQDALLLSNDQRMMRIFQGAGLASTWILELPKAVNDINYDALTDVRLVFYYKARFDPDLRARVLTQLASRPGINARERGIPLRWIYPDAFYRFQDTGTLAFSLRASDFRSNETNPIITSIGVLVVTDGSVAGSGLRVALATPTQAAVTAQTDATGDFVSAAGNAWAPLAAGSAVGNYAISLSAADNPTLVLDGRLTLTPIVNIVLVLGYSFTPRA